MIDITMEFPYIPAIGKQCLSSRTVPIAVACPLVAAHLPFPIPLGKHQPFQGWQQGGIDRFLGIWLVKERDEYEATRQNEPVKGSAEEKKRQEKPEKIAWGEEARLVGLEPIKT